MRISIYQPVPLPKHFALLAIGICSLLCHTASAQTQPERFWLAGRYDGNRIIVYFDGVKFNGTMPTSGHKLAPAIAERFFDPVELAASYVAQFQKGPKIEHFALGDQYDLLADYDEVVTVTLTTLVGSEMDEEVGNDSFIGALATVDEHDLPYLRKNHYVLRRHREPPAGKSNNMPKPNAVYAGLQVEPIPFDIQKQIVMLLNEGMKSKATETERKEAVHLSPSFLAQAFRLADGTLRYYARAEWGLGEEGTEGRKTVYALGAWVGPLPRLHILAWEKRTSPYDGISSVLPDLLNVVNLGGGKTGIIVGISGEDSGSLGLFEYRDGTSLRDMVLLHAIGSGE